MHKIVPSLVPQIWPSYNISPTADFPELRRFPLSIRYLSLLFDQPNGHLNTTYMFASTWATNKALLIPFAKSIYLRENNKTSNQPTIQPTQQPSIQPTILPTIAYHPLSSFKTLVFPPASSGSFKETSASKIMDTDITPETALTYTPPPEFNTSPLKHVNLEDDPASYWVLVTFQGLLPLNFGRVTPENNGITESVNPIFFQGQPPKG